jgi:hypothetical protein
MKCFASVAVDGEDEVKIAEEPFGNESKSDCSLVKGHNFLIFSSFG